MGMAALSVRGRDLNRAAEAWPASTPWAGRARRWRCGAVMAQLRMSLVASTRPAGIAAGPDAVQGSPGQLCGRGPGLATELLGRQVRTCCQYTQLARARRVAP